MRRTGRPGYYLIVITLIISGCEKETDADYDFLAFPIGRSFLSSGTVEVKIREVKYDQEFIFDSRGGYWLSIPKTELSEGDNLKILFTRKKEELVLFNESAADEQKWTDPSYYIDTDNEAIKTKAGQLTEGLNSNLDKAKKIHLFVIGHVTMKDYKDSFLVRASETFELGYGTCMNFSRLYVALCRAAGVPARTIWGIVYGHSDDNIYDYHHQWAEILDDSGNWHPCDFNYTQSFDLNDIRYLDLIYGAEENSIVKDRASNKILPDNLKFYHDYPVTLTGRLGFKLLYDNRPDSMTVEYSYMY